MTRRQRQQLHKLTRLLQPPRRPRSRHAVHGSRKTAQKSHTDIPHATNNDPRSADSGTAARGSILPNLPLGYPARPRGRAVRGLGPAEDRNRKRKGLRLRSRPQAADRTTVFGSTEGRSGRGVPESSDHLDATPRVPLCPTRARARLAAATLYRHLAGEHITAHVSSSSGASGSRNGLSPSSSSAGEAQRRGPNTPADGSRRSTAPTTRSSGLRDDLLDAPLWSASGAFWWRQPDWGSRSPADGTTGSALIAGCDMTGLSVHIAARVTFQELVPTIESLVDSNPRQERLRRQLMLALYRAGRPETRCSPQARTN